MEWPGQATAVTSPWLRARMSHGRYSAGAVPAEERQDRAECGRGRRGSTWLEGVRG